jgi:hypothetical protein
MKRLVVTNNANLLLNQFQKDSNLQLFELNGTKLKWQAE